jgi:hypothetical protein
MMRWTRTLAALAALMTAATALGQDDGGGTVDLFAGLGPVLGIFFLIVWYMWGGFKLIPGLG